jgi:carbon storage regulator
MLVLSRHRDEAIRIGDDITIIVVEIRGDKVRLGIEAPQHVAVHRGEVYDAIKRHGAKDNHPIGRKHAAASLAQRWACSPKEVFDRADVDPPAQQELENELARLRAEANHT